jgi:hypothetical protein
MEPLRSVEMLEFFTEPTSVVVPPTSIMSTCASPYASDSAFVPSNPPRGPEEYVFNATDLATREEAPSLR